jgi:hypothetical protein
MSAHGFQMSINWEYYDQYGKSGGYSAQAYFFVGVGYLLTTLILWVTLYYKKKKHFGSAEILFDKGQNKYLSVIVRFLIVLLIFSFIVLGIPYWIIDVPNGDFG